MDNDKYGKWRTGLLWLVTGGLFGIGWIIDLFLINLLIQAKRSLGKSMVQKLLSPWILDYR